MSKIDRIAAEEMECSVHRFKPLSSLEKEFQSLMLRRTTSEDYEKAKEQSEEERNHGT